MEYLSQSRQQKEGTIQLFHSDVERDSFQKDLAYLIRMRDMDAEIRSKWSRGDASMERVRMCDVVPVAGLVQARLSIIYCELQTAMELWGGRRGTLEGEQWRERLVFYKFHFRESVCI